MNWKSYFLGAGIFGCCGCVLVLPAFAQDVDKEFALEYTYIEKLQTDFAMPDLANIALARARLKFRDARFVPRFQALEINSLVSLGNFEEVQTIIKAQPDQDSFSTWRLQLALADGYYSHNRYDDFLKIHQEFFKKFTKAPEGEEEFYLNLCYRHAQLLARQKRFNKECVVMYQHLMKQPMPDSLARSIRAEMVTQMLKVAPDLPAAERTALLVEADTENDKQFWVNDPIFGQAVVSKAHILSLQGKSSEAQDMVELYMPRLKQIHDALAEYAKANNAPEVLRESPMPQCRFLLASLLWADVQKIAASPEPAAEDREQILTLLLGARGAQNKRKANGAYNHFVNVFINHPESQWAMDAGEEAEKVNAFIKERFGVDVPIPITPESIRRMREAQYEVCKTVFTEGDFAKAALLFEAFLPRFPETFEAVEAHVSLALSYANLASERDPGEERDRLEIYFDMVTGNLAERYSGLAGNLKLAASAALRKLAENMGDAGYPQRRASYYNLMFRHYPDDAAVPALLHQFANDAENLENLADALKYFTLLEKYEDYQHYPSILTRIAAIHKKNGATTQQLAYLDKAVEVYKTKKDNRNEAAYINALLSRADETRNAALATYISTNQAERIASVVALANTAKLYGEITKEVAELAKAAPQDEALQLQYEKAAFFYANVLEYLNHPPERAEAFRKAAIAAYEDFLKRFPKSQFAPRALLQIGTMYTTLKDAAAAENAFARLTQTYPESDMAKNAAPMLAKALLELGFAGEAVANYKKMFQDRGKYTHTQYFEAGQAILNAPAPDFNLALEAFDLALQSPDTRIQSPALLGRAKALVGLKRYEDARSTLLEFEKKFAGYESILEAWFLLVEVCSIIGEGEKDTPKRNLSFSQGVNTLKNIARHLNTPEGKARTDLAAVMLLIRRMNAEKNFGLTKEARDTCGTAAQGFNAIFLIPPGNEKIDPYLHEAYKEGIPIYLEYGAPDIAAERATAYLNTFPEGKYVQQIRLLLNQAQSQM